MTLRANYTFVLIPLFTIVFSVWLLDEEVNAAFVVGGVLVLAGVYIGALRVTGRRPLDPSFVSDPPDNRVD